MAGVPALSRFEPELRVVTYVATKRGDAERGPQVRIHPADAKRRAIVDGEVVWVKGPRGEQVAPVMVDATIVEHTCALRDIAGVDLSESVRVVKPDLDAPRRVLA